MVGNPRPRDYKYEEFDGTDLVKCAVRRFQCQKKQPELRWNDYRFEWNPSFLLNGL